MLRKSPSFRPPRLSIGRRLSARVLPLLALLGAVAGCAEILGLEPPGGGAGGSGGTGADTLSVSTTGTTGGGGTSGGLCTLDADCGEQPEGLPFCQQIECVNQTCQLAPTGTCPKGVLAVRLVPGTGGATVRSLAATADGQLFATGVYSLGEADIGGCALPSIPFNVAGAFVVKLSRDLRCEWLVALRSSAGDSLELDRAIVAGGRLWVSGNASGTPEVIHGDEIATPVKPEGLDGLLLGFELDGILFNAYTIGGSSTEAATALTSTTVGDAEVVYVVVEGKTGKVRYKDDGGDPLKYPDVTQSVSAHDAAVVAIDAATGAPQWAKAFGTSNGVAPRSAAVWGGRLMIGGNADGDWITPICMSDLAIGPRAFVFDVNPETGEATENFCDAWAAGASYPTGLVPIKNGPLAAAGRTYGGADFGCSTISDNQTGNNAWLRLAGPSAPGCVAAKILIGPTDAYGQRLALLGTDLILAGSYTGTLNGVDSGSNDYDLFVHRYGLDLGEPVWHRELGWKSGLSPDGVSEVLVTPEAKPRLFVAGRCAGTELAGVANCDEIAGDGYIMELSP